MDLRVSSTIPRTENSKTKVDKQSLKFVDTPAAENQKSKIDENTLELAQPFHLHTPATANPKTKWNKQTWELVQPFKKDLANAVDIQDSNEELNILKL